MATLTKVQLAERILTNIGVKAAGQTASDDDINTVEEAIDSVYAQLEYKGKVQSFTLAAIPEWAWTPLRDIVSADLVGEFGLSGQRVQLLYDARERAKRVIDEQTQGRAHPVPVEARYY